VDSHTVAAEHPVDISTGHVKIVARSDTAMHAVGFATAFMEYQVQVGDAWNWPRQVDSHAEPSTQLSERCTGHWYWRCPTAVPESAALSPAT
jgi:hypothetical protein